MTDMDLCDDPSRYRYQRGCRCAGCVGAQAEYKRAWHEKRAEREGRVHGQRACTLCGVAVSTIGRSRAEYCSECAGLSRKEQDRRYKDRVKEIGKSLPNVGRVASGIYEIRDLPLAELVVGGDVRLDEDDEALAELAESIAEVGVIQPLVVRELDDGWEVIAGRRRLAAARIAESETVPCVIRDLDDEQSFDVTLAENLHRRDLSWIEVALAYERLVNRGMQQQEVAALVGKSGAHVSHVLRLLTLPKELQDQVHRRELPYRDALDIARADNGKIKHMPSRDSGAYDELVSHWQNRHGRLLAGITSVIKSQGDDVELKQMLRRLVQQDRTGEPTEATKPTERTEALTPLTPEQAAMVEANTGLIGLAIKKWGPRDADEDDAFQDGMFGLARATQLFDPSRGFTFSTFALPHIRAAIQRGRGRAEGINYRRASIETGRPKDNNWRPRSLDATVPGTDRLTLADVIAGDDGMEDDVIAGLLAGAPDLLPKLEAACQTERERKILAAVAAGQSMRSLALAEGLSSSTFHEGWRTLRERLAEVVSEAMPERAAS